MNILAIGCFALAGCLPSTPAQRGPDGPAPVSTPIPETVTPTAPPTASGPSPTSTRRAVPSSAPPQAPASIEETFDDNRNGWFTDPALVTVAGGTYNHTIDCPEAHISPHCGSFIRMPFSFPRSFRMEIDVTLVNASPGAGALVGFQVRRSDVHYYFINYSLTEGYTEISYISQNGLDEIVPRSPTSLIRTAVGERNKLGIELKGFSLAPLVNGQAIAPANNANIREAGDTYLVILVSRGHSAELQFDHLSVQGVE